MRRFILWGGIALTLAMAANAAAQYYYSSGHQIPLHIDSSRVVPGTPPWRSVHQGEADQVGLGNDA